MVEKYPEEQNNPRYEPGQRPGDQPPPRKRVPDDYQQGEGDPRGLVADDTDSRSGAESRNEGQRK